MVIFIILAVLAAVMFLAPRLAGKRTEQRELTRGEQYNAWRDSEWWY